MVKLITGQNGLDQFKTATLNSEVNILFMYALEITVSDMYNVPSR